MSSKVYFLQVGADGPIKIGCTKLDVEYRVRALQLSSPHILRWIGFFPGTHADEKIAHELLKNSSLRGEWFYPTVEVLAFVAQRSPGFEPVIVENKKFHGRKRSAETCARMSKGQRDRHDRLRAALAHRNS
jgi:Meiotically up-regulated gene 113